MANQIVVVGTGYVGLPAAIMLARAGYQVVGVDINEEIVRAINSGEMHLNEQELWELMALPEVRANLAATSHPVAGDVFIIAVPTPVDQRHKTADLSQVVNALESLVPHLHPGNLVIIESTVPPLTCREVVAPILERSGLRVGDELLLAHCPERILPGNIFHEIVSNDRVIGGVNRESALAAREIYASFVQGQLWLTDDVTAELCKLMENTYRDINIALANELAAVAEGLGCDIWETIALANQHPRVSLLSPGIGVGGHCIPIDPWFIAQVNPAATRLIATARSINDGVPSLMAAKIKRMLSDIPDPLIVALGVAYKPDSEDIRESPALEVIRLLEQAGYRVVAYDPLVDGYREGTLLERARRADCLALLVEHKIILRELEEGAEQIRQVMRHPRIFRPWASPKRTDHWRTSPPLAAVSSWAPPGYSLFDLGNLEQQPEPATT